jgi:hypothetical protein
MEYSHYSNIDWYAISYFQTNLSYLCYQSLIGHLTSFDSLGLALPNLNYKVTFKFIELLTYFKTGQFNMPEEEAFYTRQFA